MMTSLSGSGSGAAGAADGGFGPTDRATAGGTPFTVTGPSTVSLDASRTGSASFTVSNVTGRPVRARVMVLPGTGADASWFQLAGESERALPVAGTATVDVAVKPPETAAAGTFTFVVGAALEEAPDQVVSGPSAGFDVPAPKKRRFPWWIVIVAAAALLILGGGGAVVWFLTRPPAAPVVSTPPTISGTAQIGSELTVAAGEWDPDDTVRVYVWQSCPETATDDADEECADIVVGADGQRATGPSYVVGAEDVGLLIRVVETAVRVDAETAGENGLDDLSDFPHASAASAMTDAVQLAPATTAIVPNVVGLSASAAQSALTAAGFQMLVTTSSAVGTCSPPVEDQNPDAGAEQPIGNTVAVTTKSPQPFSECIKIADDFNEDWVVLVPDWGLEKVLPGN